MHASSLGSSMLSTSHQPLPPRSGLSCLFLSEPMGVLLWSNSALTHASLMRHTLDAICLATTVRPAFMRLKISVGFVQFMGVFPYPPCPTSPNSSPPPLYWILLRQQIHWHIPQPISVVWRCLLKHSPFHGPSLWFDQLQTSITVKSTMLFNIVNLHGGMMMDLLVI